MLRASHLVPLHNTQTPYLRCLPWNRVDSLSSAFFLSSSNALHHATSKQHNGGRGKSFNVGDAAELVEVRVPRREAPRIDVFFFFFSRPPLRWVILMVVTECGQRCGRIPVGVLAPPRLVVQSEEVDPCLHSAVVLH